LKVAVLGAGDMGGRHVNAWTELGHEVVSITDMDQGRARELAARYSVPTVCDDYRRALADPEPDVVSICLPLAEHAPAAALAAEQGKHVFTEKPLCRTFAEAEVMESAIQRAGVRFGIGFQRNLAEGVELLRSWAAEGRFGRPMLFSSDLLQEVRPKRVMHDRNGNNGPLTDAGCHYYLLWQTVFRSRPKMVHATGRIIAGERPEVAHLRQLSIDTAVVVIEYESGDVGTFTVSWGLAAGSSMRGRPDRIVGPRGGAEGETNSCLTRFEDDGVVEVLIERKDLHQVELGLFADWIGGGPPFPYGLAEGRQMLAVTQAIFDSIDSGRPVPVSAAWWSR
jgi:myo-inositol 2-dehydrogenase/D-chiro-inositol 1-dehydrogenase